MTEFDNFGGMLQKAQKNIQGGLDDLDKLVGTRTKAIQRKLRGVEALDSEASSRLLDVEQQLGISDE
jgi:DNA recombination protein RmuC